MTVFGNEQVEQTFDEIRQAAYDSRADSILDDPLEESTGEHTIPTVHLCDSTGDILKGYLEHKAQELSALMEVSILANKFAKAKQAAKVHEAVRLLLKTIDDDESLTT